MITEKHLDIALAAAEAGELGGHAYNQEKWCGTSCCVLGFARLAAGVPEANQGPQPGEIEDTPRAQTIARLMSCTSPDIVRVMRSTQADGSIDLRVADLRVADLNGANLRDANLRDATGRT